MIHVQKFGRGRCHIFAHENMGYINMLVLRSRDVQKL
jgi:hypothetical protein